MGPGAARMPLHVPVDRWFASETNSEHSALRPTTILWNDD